MLKAPKTIHVKHIGKLNAIIDSGCGAVGKAVAAGISVPRFKSNHQHDFIFICRCLSKKSIKVRNGFHGVWAFEGREILTYSHILVVVKYER